MPLSTRHLLRRLPAGGSCLLGRRVCRALSRSALTQHNKRSTGLSLDIYRGVDNEPIYLVGQQVEARILYINETGAMTKVDGGAAHGIVSISEIEIYQSVFSKSLKVGDSISGYVARKLPNTSPLNKGIPIMSLLLRPLKLQRILSTAELLKDALSESSTGTLPVGDKSTPEEIAAVLGGISKVDFKRGLGQLLTTGIAFPDAHATYLTARHPDLVKEKVDAKKKGPKLEERKSKPLFVTGAGRTLYVGPIPKTFTAEDVTELVNSAAGVDCVDAVKFATDKNGSSKGSAFVLVKLNVQIRRVVNLCKGLEVGGVKVRVNRHS